MNYSLVNSDIWREIGYRLCPSSEPQNYVGLSDLSAYIRASRGIYDSCGHILVDLRGYYSRGIRYPLESILDMIRRVKSFVLTKWRRDSLTDLFYMVHIHRISVYARASETSGGDGVIFDIIHEYEEISKEDYRFMEKCKVFREIPIRVRTIIGADYGKIMAERYPES